MSFINKMLKTILLLYFFIIFQEQIQKDIQIGHFKKSSSRNFQNLFLNIKIKLFLFLEPMFITHNFDYFDLEFQCFSLQAYLPTHKTTQDLLLLKLKLIHLTLKLIISIYLKLLKLVSLSLQTLTFRIQVYTISPKKLSQN